MTTTGKLDNSNLPWVEKYRPSSLDDILSHTDIVRTIQRFVSEKRMPHLMFYGPPGTGKTSTILACAKQLYSPKEFSTMVLELNASDDRGIDVVREQILTFASTRSIFSSGFKLVILDEADSMTIDAQNALRRIIEKFTTNTRFCLICNYMSLIIPAIQSRCTRFRFAPLSSQQMAPRLQHVIEAEGVETTPEGIKAVLTLAEGDMRKAINVLQGTFLACGTVDEDAVYACAGRPLRSDVANIVNYLLNDNFKDAYQKIQGMQVAKGLALQDLITEIHLYVVRIDFSKAVRMYLLDKLAELEDRVCSEVNEKIQLASLVSSFVVAREMTTDAV